MKTIRYNINGQELSIRLDDKAGTIAGIALDGQAPAVAEADMPAYAAVIALALIQHEVEVVHDDEPGVITLSAGSSAWADPAEMMCNL